LRPERIFEVRALAGLGRTEEAIELLELAGRPGDARSLIEKSSSGYQQRLGPADYVKTRLTGHRGILAAESGDREEAMRYSALLERADWPGIGGWTTYYRALIAARLDEKELSVGLLRQAIAEGWTGGALHAVPHLEPLLGYPPFQELTRPKG
jgi:hypothetical protein